MKTVVTETAHVPAQGDDTTHLQTTSWKIQAQDQVCPFYFFPKRNWKFRFIGGLFSFLNAVRERKPMFELNLGL